MNIKEHSEAGHYPKDDKGRALVPMKSGRAFVVCATDKPGPCPILGWAEDIHHAAGHYADSSDLLPPPPRKVKVTRWAVMLRGHPDKAGECVHTIGPDEQKRWACSRRRPGEFLVELTGEYEELWS